MKDTEINRVIGQIRIHIKFSNRKGDIMTNRKKELLSVKDIMEITGLGRDKVYELLHCGEFTVHRFGNRFMAVEKDFYEWLFTNNKRKNSYVFKLKGL